MTAKHDPIALYRNELRRGNRRFAASLAAALRRDPRQRARLERAQVELRAGTRLRLTRAQRELVEQVAAELGLERRGG